MNEYTSIILVATDGKLVFQQKDIGPEINNSGKITTFGGMIEKGEKPLESAIREVEEELAVKLKEDDLYFLGNYKDKDFRGNETFIYAYVTRNIHPNKLKLREGKNIFYFSREDDLENYNFSALAKQIVKDYRKSEFQ